VAAPFFSESSIAESNQAPIHAKMQAKIAKTDGNSRIVAKRAAGAAEMADDGQERDDTPEEIRFTPSPQVWKYLGACLSSRFSNDCESDSLRCYEQGISRLEDR
jgi:hypothetical protein